ncbi:MAG: cell filamentation protein Fic, partial [Bacilli bacterium]|nr:cell filamentation protein Fic [Bacilli bacterium]
MLIYEDKDGNVVVDAIFKDETLWLTQKGMSQVFEVGVPAISKHLNNIFNEEELNPKVVISKMETTTKHGAIENKKQTTDVNIYSLDAIIAVGYRVNSKK